MAWKTIKCAFVENNNASRVITTTRIQDVGTACCLESQDYVYQMQPLNEFHSRSLFFKRLFDPEDSSHKQFKDISNEMLRKCKGVPLAITSIASLLAVHKNIEVWERICRSLCSELDTNPTLEWIRHVLILSYNDLSHELKTCLLYLGMYPEDHIIRKEDLVRKWMAEGFVREKDGLDLEEAVENCFNELINRNMIQPCFHEYGSGEVSSCQVHDLMLDLIKSKCKEENFITIIERNYPMNGASQVRRISHQFHHRDVSLTVKRMSVSKVRSYISFCLAEYIPPLVKFDLLRVLDVKATDSSLCLDLSVINNLFLLRYVRVQGFRLKLPKKFGKLNHLMTLDMSGSWLQEKSDFNSLVSLRHLKVSGRVTFENGLSKLCNLRDLSCFCIRSNSIKCISDLGELISLRNLELVYDYPRPDSIENTPETILAASVMKLGNSNLRHLSFQARSRATAPSAQFWSNCLTFPPHLRNLILSREILMPKLPNWIAYADRLAHAILRVNELRSDDVQVLGQLPCLTWLELTAYTFPEKNIIIHPNTFHSLKIFELFGEGLQSLTFELDAMPRLQRLHIPLDAREKGAMELQEGSPVGGIENLASLEIISSFIFAKCDQWSIIESVCREAISRHPKSQAMKIAIRGYEFDENGKIVNEFWN